MFHIPAVALRRVIPPGGAVTWYHPREKEQSLGSCSSISQRFRIGDDCCALWVVGLLALGTCGHGRLTLRALYFLRVEEKSGACSHYLRTAAVSGDVGQL